MAAARAATASIANGLPRIAKCVMLLAGGLLSGCSPAQLVNALVPHGDFALISDRPYGALARQKLDIYTPVAHQGPKPVVIFFYGGIVSWS